MASFHCDFLGLQVGLLCTDDIPDFLQKTNVICPSGVEIDNVFPKIERCSELAQILSKQSISSLAAAKQSGVCF